jgi:outer membrane protein, heavy metal efflux system
LQYLQLSRSIYQNQLLSIKQLTQAYQKQVEQGNVPQGEYIRLKALELEIAKNINELKQRSKRSTEGVETVDATACHYTIGNNG